MAAYSNRGIEFRRLVGRACKALGFAICTFGIMVSAGGPDPALAGELPYFVELPGPPRVRYVAGALDRSVNLQERFALLREDFNSWSKSNPPLVLYVMPRREWEAAELPAPYGLPSTIAGGLALAATGDSETVELWRALLGRDLTPMEGAVFGGSPLEMASLGMTDLLGTVEGSRILVSGTLVYTDSYWLKELLAHIVATSELWKRESNRLGVIVDAFESLRRQGKPGPLPDGPSHPDQSLARWIWYQGTFQRGARVIADVDGAKGAAKIFKLVRKTGNRLTWDALVAEYPGLGSWLEESFGSPDG